MIISSLNLILNSRGSFSKFQVQILGLSSLNTVYCWEMITPGYLMFIPPEMTISITWPSLHDLSEMILRYQLFVSHGSIFLIPEHLFLQHSKHPLVIYSNWHGPWGIFAASSNRPNDMFTVFFLTTYRRLVYGKRMWVERNFQFYIIWSYVTWFMHVALTFNTIEYHIRQTINNWLSKYLPG